MCCLVCFLVCFKGCFLQPKMEGKKKAVNNADGKYILHRGEEKKRYKKLVVGLKEKDHAL